MSLGSAGDRAADAAVVFALELAQPAAGDGGELGRLDRDVACSKLVQISGWQPTVLHQARGAIDAGRDPAAHELLAAAALWAAWSAPE
jgi:hypothetical protein